jgi:hypothetical protein
MTFESFKEDAQRWYAKAAQFFMFQNLMMYLFACITAHDAVGLTGYIGFLYHCCQWGGK